MRSVKDQAIDFLCSASKTSKLLYVAATWTMWAQLFNSTRMTHQMSAEACKVFLCNGSLVFGWATCASGDNMQDKHDSFSSLVKWASCA